LPSNRLGREMVDVVTTVNKLAAIGVKVYCLQLGGTDLTSAARRAGGLVSSGNSPAAKGGFRPGDVVTSIGSRRGVLCPARSRRVRLPPPVRRARGC
jgi:S1-C subfamily serine protease